MKISDPQINEIVKHTGWRFENDPNYPCDVIITGGSLMSNGLLSNFFYWKRITENGISEKEECGYGSFEKTENEYNIETLIYKTT